MNAGAVFAIGVMVVVCWVGWLTWIAPAVRGKQHEQQWRRDQIRERMVCRHGRTMDQGCQQCLSEADWTVR